MAMDSFFRTYPAINKKGIWIRDDEVLPLAEMEKEQLKAIIGHLQRRFKFANWGDTKEERAEVKRLVEEKMVECQGYLERVHP